VKDKTPLATERELTPFVAMSYRFDFGFQTERQNPGVIWLICRFVCADTLITQTGHRDEKRNQRPPGGIYAKNAKNREIRAKTHVCLFT